MDEAIKTRLGQYVALWNSAERVSKQAELLNGKMVLPAINELRYAGRWAVLAIESIIQGNDRIDELTTVMDALGYACLCCNQAKHDAIDSIVLNLHSKIDQIGERYTPRIISMYVKDYDNFLEEVEQIDSSILSSREDRSNRNDLYEKIANDHLSKIADYLSRIRSAEVRINEQLEEEMRREAAEEQRHTELVEKLQGESKRNKIYFRISFLFNIGLLLLAIAALAPLMHETKEFTISTPSSEVPASGTLGPSGLNRSAARPGQAGLNRQLKR